AVRRLLHLAARRPARQGGPRPDGLQPRGPRAVPRPSGSRVRPEPDRRAEGEWAAGQALPQALGRAANPARAPVAAEARLLRSGPPVAEGRDPRRARGAPAGAPGDPSLGPARRGGRAGPRAAARRERVAAGLGLDAARDLAPDLRRGPGAGPRRGPAGVDRVRPRGALTFGRGAGARRRSP